MNCQQYNAFCRSLPATTYVCQWGGAHVWKVGGKVFAIGSPMTGDRLGVTFKTSDLNYEMLRAQPGLRPAPYLASRGMKWIQHHDQPGLAYGDLGYFIRESHRIVSQGLSKRKQRELGLIG